MKKISFLLKGVSIFVFLLLVAVSSFAGEKIDYHKIYVDLSGSDTAAGTLEAPLATFQKAAERAGKLRRSGTPVSIILRGGRWYLPRGGVITEKNALSDAPLLITAFTGEEAVLIGGFPVIGWKKLSDSPELAADLSGRFSHDFLKTVARTGKEIFYAPLPREIESASLKKYREFYWNDSRMIWARWPNFEPRYPYSGGWAYVDGEPFNMYKEVENENMKIALMKEKKNWKKPDRGAIMIFPRHNWSSDLVDLVSIDFEKRLLTAQRNFRFAARPMDRYCVFGMPEELDDSGEWVIDFEKKIVLFIPPKKATVADLNENPPTLGSTSAVLTLEGAKNVTISGLTVTASLGQGVYLGNCSNCRVEKCKIHDLGFSTGCGVNIYNGENCRVSGCDIWKTGFRGVELTGGDIYKLKSCGHVAENNYVHHTGCLNKSGGSAFGVGGCGITVTRNTAHDIPRCPITFTGVRIVIEYNRLLFGNLESEDAGMIYCNGGGSWINGRGSVIRYNHLADSIGFGHKKGIYQFYMFTWGLYLDDTSADVKVYGNIVERCTVGDIHLHNARENEIYNNIFIDGGERQVIQLSGWTNDPNQRMMKRHIKDMTRNYQRAIKSPEWREMRDMKVPPLETFLPDGTSMRGNEFYNNICYYVNQPESRYVNYSNFNRAFNKFDRNIIFNGSKDLPKTPVSLQIEKVAADLSSKVPNINFSETGGKSLPKDWVWFMKTREDARAEVSAPGVFRLYAAYNPEKQHIQHAVFHSSGFKLEPGCSYRIRYQMRQKDADGETRLSIVTCRKGYWKNYGAENFSNNSSEFRSCESIFRIPRKGDADYDDRMTDCCFHLTFLSKTGWTEVKNIALEKVDIADSWRSWQLEGQDRHSVIADPMFVDLKKGDFRLKPESPALKLGFKQIPVEKIGVYEDPVRASWPVVEADGVRNHPEWLEIPPKK